MTKEPNNPYHNTKPEVSFKNTSPDDLPPLSPPKKIDPPTLQSSPADQLYAEFDRLIERVEVIAPPYNSETYQFTEKELKKLAKAFLRDHSVAFACLHAKIKRKYFDTVMSANPDLKDFFDDLKKVPEAMAQETIVSSLSSERMAAWYVERRANHKYNTKTVVESKGGLADALDALEQSNNSPHLESPAHQS